MALLMRSAQQLGNFQGLVAQAGQANDQRRLPVAPATDRLDERNAVVVFVFGGQQVGGNQAGGFAESGGCCGS